jgi:hypothetical protein
MPGISTFRCDAQYKANNGVVSNYFMPYARNDGHKVCRDSPPTVLCPIQLSNGMPVGKFITVLSALTDGIIPALGDNLLVVAEDIRRGDKRRHKK